MLLNNNLFLIGIQRALIRIIVRKWKGVFYPHRPAVDMGDPEDLLERFSSHVQVYAEKNTDRSHYEYVAKALKEMLKLKGGELEVRLLVDVFRQAYKRRTAMMGILKDF